jgi:periplasmic mercuric ion binding protein
MPIMKNKGINIFLILVTVALLVLFGFYVRIGATADAVVVLKTAGMNCSSCAGKITNALETQKGVAATEVDLDGGWVIAGYDSKQVKPESLAEKVSGTGFASRIQAVLTPEQFRQITGRDIGRQAKKSGCCGGKGGGCGSKNNKG